jgi:hypothetical protein
VAGEEVEVEVEVINRNKHNNITIIIAPYRLPIKQSCDEHKMCGPNAG